MTTSENEDYGSRLDPAVRAGQAAYTRRSLALYDLLVLGLSNRWIWRCPTDRILALHRRHVTGNHLDCGVGTGFYLDRCGFPGPDPRIVLIDLNPDCLAVAAARIGRYRPQVHRANLLAPLAGAPSGFDSLSLTYLLHCLPGAIPEKAVVFDHLKALANPGAVIFGATLLSGGVPRGGLARRLAGLYNRKGIFSNRDDGLADLEDALAKRFEILELETVGCAALFAAKLS